MAERRWQIKLSQSDICYSEGKREVNVNTDNIQEFQFEMEANGNRYGDIPTSAAYVILKDSANPLHLFTIAIPEECALLNQSKAYEFCDQILKIIGGRYHLPIFYKLSVDTRQKRNIVPLVLLCFLFIFLIMWLIVHFHVFQKH
jgi:hypothetical protein